LSRSLSRPPDFPPTPIAVLLSRLFSPKAEREYLPLLQS
jgi:hypothetical protein